MPGLNRKSSYQTAEDILNGNIKTLSGRTLRFIAETVIKVREREQSYRLENERVRQYLAKVEFKHHILATLRTEAIALRKENNRLKILRTRHGLPVDAETSRFALFGWRDTPQGGWRDFLSAHPDWKSARERQKQVRVLFPFTHIVNIETCDRGILSVIEKR